MEGLFGGKLPIVAPLIFVRFSLLFISTHSENLIHLATTGLKVQNFGGLVWGGTSQPGTPNFIPALAFPDTFNCLNFEYNAFSTLKVDSQRRIRKKNKKSKKKERKEK